eukprot:3660891-Amphidinium_carterae.1
MPVHFLKLVGTGVPRYTYYRLYAMKKEHVKRGFSWTDALELELRDGVRSCERGIGPPRKAKPLGLDVFAALGSLEPLVPGGPVLPGVGCLVTFWWLLREVEMSTATRRQVVLADGTGCGIATLLLPVSKTDQLALGAERTHGCSCPSSLCPVAAVRRLLQHSPQADLDSPLWPTVWGHFPDKAAVVATLQALDRQSG